MSNFSQILTAHIKQSKLTVITISKISGIERQSIHHFMKGTRIPSSKEFIYQIADIIRLSPNHISELLKYYEQAKVGDYVYERRQYIKSFFENMNEYFLFPDDKQNKIKDTCISDPNFPEVSIINSSTKIYDMIINMVIEAYQNKDQFKMITQPQKALMRKLSSTVGHLNDFTMTHIFFFHDNVKNNNENFFNIQYLDSIMPLLLSKCDYNPEIYYENTDSHINEMSLLPNLFLTKTYVLCVSNDFNEAILYRNSKVITFYSYIFDKFLKNTKNRFNKTSTLLDYFHAIENAESQSKEFFTMQSEPCILPFITEHDCKTYISKTISNPGEIISFLSNRQQLKSGANSDTLLNVFITEEGLENFIKTGRVSELPYECYEPLPSSRCKELLCCLHGAILNDKHVPILIKSDKFNFSNYITISTFGFNYALFTINHPSKGFLTLQFSERDIVDSFQDFFKYLLDSDLVYSKEETLKIMQKYIR